MALSPEEAWARVQRLAVAIADCLEDEALGEEWRRGVAMFQIKRNADGDIVIDGLHLTTER